MGKEITKGKTEMSATPQPLPVGGTTGQTENADTGNPKPKRTAKDSVFCDLFSDKKYLLQLYQTLHPEDEKIAETYQRYFIDTDQSLFDTDPVTMPVPELYVLYTGDRRNVPRVITLSDEFFGGRETAIDVRVKVLVGEPNGTDIISQYATFTRVFNEQVRIHGRTREAVDETIRICNDKNVLKEYLQKHRMEVVDIMMTLYDYDEILDNYVASMGRKIREERDRETIFAMSDDGDPDDKIARVMRMSVADVQAIIASRATTSV